MKENGNITPLWSAVWAMSLCAMVSGIRIYAC